MTELRKLDRVAQERIVAFLRERVLATEDPRLRGKALIGGREKLWRYRVGDYRIICKVDDDLEVILVLRVAHRREAYR